MGGQGNSEGPGSALPSRRRRPTRAAGDARGLSQRRDSLERRSAQAVEGVAGVELVETWRQGEGIDSCCKEEYPKAACTELITGLAAGQRKARLGRAFWTHILGHLSKMRFHHPA